MWKVSEGLAALHLEALATIFHNHDPSEHAAIHANNRRPTEVEKQEILRLDRGMTIPVLPWPTGLGIMELVLTGSGYRRGKGCGGHPNSEERSGWT